MKRHIKDFNRFSVNENRYMDQTNDMGRGDIFYKDKWTGEEFDTLDDFLDASTFTAVGFFDGWISSGNIKDLKGKFLYICNLAGGFDDTAMGVFNDNLISSSGESDFRYVESGPSIRAFTNRTLSEVFGVDFLMKLAKAGEWDSAY